MALGGSKQEVREAIHGLGLEMESLPQCEQGLRHIYADGLYGREWTCDAGCIIVTEIHRVQHISSLIKGKIQIEGDPLLMQKVAKSFRRPEA